MMISLREKEKKLPVHSFRADDTSVYSDKINGYFIWDVSPEMRDEDCECWMDHDEDEV